MRTSNISRVGLSVLLSASFLAAGCGSRSSGQAAPGASGLSPISLGRRLVTVPALADDANQLAQDMRAGALALYRAIGTEATGAQPLGNMVFSPMALQLALGMTYVGTSGQTANELALAMRWRQTPQAFAAAQAGLLNFIASQVPDPTQDRAAILQTATRVFLRDDLTLLPSYAAALADTYQAPAAFLNFGGAPELSRQRINAWAGEQTGGRITDILPAGSISQDTALVLAAALRFKAFWHEKLSRDDSLQFSFTTASHQTASVSALRDTGNYPLTTSGSESVLYMPYAGERFQLVLVRPNGDLASYEQGLTQAHMEELLGPGTKKTSLVALTMPPFDIASSFTGLTSTLGGMGVKALFDTPNDLSILDTPPAPSPSPASTRIHTSRWTRMAPRPRPSPRSPSALA